MIYNLKKSPEDIAAAHFQCELSLDRLRMTPDHEIELAKTKDPRHHASCLSAVYVVGNAANTLHKIGYADNLKIRFNGLNTGSPVELYLRHFVYFVDFSIAKQVESGAHKRLSEYRRRGEWFEVTKEQAGEAIAAVALERKFRWWTAAERLEFVRFRRKVHHGMIEKANFYGQA